MGEESIVKRLPKLKKLKEDLNRYALVDPDGKIIHKFRTINSAKNLKVQMQKLYFKELKIIELEGG